MHHLILVQCLENNYFIYLIHFSCIMWEVLLTVVLEVFSMLYLYSYVNVEFGLELV